MKKSLFILFIISCLMYSIISCNTGGNTNLGDNEIITEKIEYPVFVKSPYGENIEFWWKENIETSKRLKFVEMLIDWSLTGKVKCYDFITYKYLSKEEVKAILNKTDTINDINISNSSDEIKQTVVTQSVDINTIERLKFLEEWSYNKTDFTISKKVLGISPSVTEYGDSLEIIGYKPLFWIFFDDKFAANQATKE